MDQELKQIQCDDMCGFMVRSHDEKEMLEIAKAHVKNVHKMTVTDTDLKARVTTVQQTAPAKK